jgi:hypothetical protein
MSRAALTAAVAALLGAGLARPAGAHPLDLGYLRVSARAASAPSAPGTAVRAELELDVAAARAVLREEDARSLTRASAPARAEALADATLRAARIEADGQPCAWGRAQAALRERTLAIAVEASCPPAVGALRWRLAVLDDPRLPSTVQILTTATVAGAPAYTTTLERGQATLVVQRAPDPSGVSFRAFVGSGVAHIGAAPGEWRDAQGWKLADGIDHILFLIALLLAGGTALRLAGIVTGFTVGHSLTLALSALGVVRPPAGVIEPVIALSIAVAAALALAGIGERQRWQIALGFGLIHGFGFAGALHELALPPRDLLVALAGYNLGVELGQLAIVAALAPAMVFLQRRPALHRAVTRVLAAGICAAGLAWLVERLWP